jgi:PEP-CTERM motif
MRYFKRMLQVSVAATALIAASAQATLPVFSGSLWEGQPASVIDNASPGTVPVGSAAVTFDTTFPFNFAAGPSYAPAVPYTIGGFLGSGSGSTILTGASELANTMDRTFIELVGNMSVTAGQIFNAIHDDGITLVIDGVTVISSTGPTPPESSSGTYAGLTDPNALVQVYYGECCGAPAVLIASSVPEPQTYAMLLAGLGLLGFMVRRRKTNNNFFAY